VGERLPAKEAKMKKFITSCGNMFLKANYDGLMSMNMLNTNI
jgi:hypothetical protein